MFGGVIVAHKEMDILGVALIRTKSDAAATAGLLDQRTNLPFDNYLRDRLLTHAYSCLPHLRQFGIGFC